MANLTVGVCLGCAMGIAGAFAASKWIMLIDVNINIAYMWVYYALFFSSILTAFGYGAARFSIIGLYGFAALCLMVPITSLLGLIPQMPLWTPSSTADYGVEIAAIGFAVASILAAKKVQQRVYEGAQNSIWYCPKYTSERTCERLA